MAATVAPTASARAAVPSARSVIAAEARQPVDLGSWMQDMQGSIGDRPLNRIVMPGSHDAGTAGITKDSGICDWGDAASTAKKNRSIAASMSKSQSGSLAQQLDAGSRYLDLRLCEQDGTWYLYHGGPMGRRFFDSFDSQGNRVKGEASELGDWVHRHKREIVIVRLRTAAPPATAKEDSRAAVSELGGILDGSRPDNPEIADGSLNPTSTYDQFMAEGKHVVLLDDTNSTTYPWAWGASAQSDRGSYVEVSHKFWDILLKTFDRNQGQENRDAVIKRASEVFARAPGGDANKFFVLQGITDPTNSIPDAALLWILKKLKLLPADQADNILLTLEHKLNKQLLDKLRGDWNVANVTDNMNIVMTDDVNQHSDGVAAGELQQEIISKNLPASPAADTLYDRSRRPDGSWTSLVPLAGTGDAFRFQGSRESVAALPDGSSQVVAIARDGNLWHTVHRTDGSWQDWRPLASADNKGIGFAARDVAVTGMPNGDSEFVAVSSAGTVYRNVRHADGSWMGWSLMDDSLHGGALTASRVAIAGMPNGSVQIAIVSGLDGKLRLVSRAADGTFWNPWTTFRGVSTPEFAAKAVSIAAMPNGDSQIAAIGSDGNVWHIIRHANGSLEDWGALEGVSTARMGASAVAIAGLPDGSSQVVAVGLDGLIYHCVRRPSGLWTWFQQGVASFPGRQVSIAGMPDGSARVLVTAG